MTSRLHLDPLVKRLFIGFALSALGSGLTMPLLYVYLSHVRGIPTATVGLLFAWMGLLGFLGSPLGGTLIDRFGPRPVMIMGLTANAVGTASLAFVQNSWQALGVATFITMGTVGLYPAGTAMITRLVPEGGREKLYGFQFMLLNAGLGTGGLISSLIVVAHQVGSFQRLYLINSLAYLGYMVIVVSLPRGTGALPPAGEKSDTVAPAGWRTVLRDRTLLRVVASSVVVVTFGYAQFEAGFSAYAVNIARVPVNTLGWAYGANTAAIVVGQLLSLRIINGRSRSRMLASAAAVWSGSWLVIALSGAVSGGASVALIVVGLGTFGLGETLWAPVAPALVNDLAPEELRGRYNALQGMSWTVAMIVGPALAGLLIGNGLQDLWVCCTVGGTAVAALLFVNLRRHLTPAQDGVPVAEHELAA
ncbi:MAG: MFS transporter [Nocardioidaceae bacterium]